MPLSDPWPVVSGVADALDIRYALTGFVKTPGIVPFSGTPSQNGTGMFPQILFSSSTMAPFIANFAVVLARTNGGTSQDDGFSLSRNQGGSTGPTLANAPATGARMDAIVLRHNDPLQGDSSSNPTAQFLVRQGNATTGTPIPGALLAGDMLLGYITVPAGATSLQSSGVVFQDAYQLAQLRGANRYVRSEAERLALPGSDYPVGSGEIVCQDNDGSVWSYSGKGHFTAGWFAIYGGPTFNIELSKSGATTPTGANTWTGTSAANWFPNGPWFTRYVNTWDGAALTVNYPGLYHLHMSLTTTTSSNKGVQLTVNSTNPDTNVISKRELTGYSVETNRLYRLNANDVIRPFLKAANANETVQVLEIGINYVAPN